MKSAERGADRPALVCVSHIANTQSMPSTMALPMIAAAIVLQMLSNTLI